MKFAVVAMVGVASAAIDKCTSQADCDAIAKGVTYKGGCCMNVESATKIKMGCAKKTDMDLIIKAGNKMPLADTTAGYLKDAAAVCAGASKLALGAAAALTVMASY